MKRAIKRLWIKALKSGKYKRAVDELKSNDIKNGYCCLGVLCELYRQENGMESIPFELFGREAEDKWSSMPHTRVLEWSGLHHGTAQRLAEINDHESQNDGFKYTTVINHIKKYVK